MREKEGLDQLYIQLDNEREKDSPCPSLSDTDWLLLILSASLSALSVTERKRERYERGTNDAIHDSTPCIVLRDAQLVTQAQTICMSCKTLDYM